MATEVLMPKLGMTMERGTILRWFKEEGDEVKEGDLLLEVMTDKINIEVESYASGRLLKIYYGPDEVVPVHHVIGYIGQEGEAVPERPPEGPAAGGGADAAEAAESPDNEAASAAANAEKVRATPAARKLARERRILLAEVAGSGPNGRIHRSDVERHLLRQAESGAKATPLARKTAAAAGVDLSAVTGSGAGGKIVRDDVLKHLAPPARAAADASEEAERVKYAGMRKVIGERMAQSAFTAPHVTLVTEVDMSACVGMRSELVPVIEKQAGVKLSYTEIIVKAVAHALILHPQVNASLQGDYIVRNRHANIGVAVAVPDGLVVPVVKRADEKGLAQLAAECKELAQRAREGRLLPDDMSGGTFTVSNLGMYAVDAFTPIINPPETAILGIGRIQEKPVGVDGRIELRPMMTLSLSFDHRVIDGAPAAAFLTGVKELLERPYHMLV